MSKVPTQNGALTGSQSETMQRWKRKAKVALFSLYLLMGVLICIQYQRGDFITKALVSSPIRLPIVKYKQFCIRPNVLRNEITEYERIGLILHTSADYLDEKIAEQVENWNAPVSLSVYLDDPSIQFACLHQFLKSLADKKPAITQNLGVHFVYKQGGDGNCEIPDHQISNPTNCVKGERKKSIEATASYPVNVIRNVARMFSETKYILIADYEHLFSKRFEIEVREVASKSLELNPKQLLVYRIFEVNETSTRMPEDRNLLSEMMKTQEAIVFHAAYYGKAHAIEGLTGWLRENSSTGISQENLKYDRYNWEPQFVSLASIPLHDELFPYQIRDNTCLRWELCRAGYQFSLLSTHFMYHRGIKRFASETQKFVKEIQKYNGKRFWRAQKLFKVRMDRLYPETKDTCPQPKA